MYFCLWSEYRGYYDSILHCDSDYRLMNHHNFVFDISIIRWIDEMSQAEVNQIPIVLRIVLTTLRHPAVSSLEFCQTPAR